jgi:hypothetical protein
VPYSNKKVTLLGSPEETERKKKSKQLSYTITEAEIFKIFSQQAEVSQNSMLEVQKYAGSGSKKAPFQFKSVGL